MKIASPDILHKTEVDGVRVNLHNDKQIRETFQQLTASVQAKMPQAEITGVSIQEMVQGGKEVIIGMTRDPQFGPLIMFGLGGIYVETFKDVAFRIAPLTEKDAEDMIREVKAYPLLMGVRGEKPVDIETIKQTLLTVSQMAMDFPQISELDINPLKIFPKGGVALDARLALTEEDWI
jgi:acetate---CoA ligase (ADP-forming)